MNRMGSMGSVRSGSASYNANASGISGISGISARSMSRSSMGGISNASSRSMSMVFDRESTLQSVNVGGTGVNRTSNKIGNYDQFSALAKSILCALELEAIFIDDDSGITYLGI